MKLARLGEVAEIVRDGIAPEKIVAGTPYLGLEHIESGGRIISSEPVANGELASTKFQFGPEHLLYGKLRPYLAKIALPDFAGICSTDILPVKAGPDLDKRYLAYFLRQPKMVDFANSRSSGANLPRLSPKALADFQIPLPPLPQQRRIAGILDQADALRRLRRQSLSRLSALGLALFVERFSRTEDMPRKRVGDFAAVKGGKRLPKGVDYASGPTNHPYIRVSNLTDGYIDPIGMKFISDEVHRTVARYIVRTDDVVISIAGTIGVVAPVRDNLDGANLTENAAKITPKPGIAFDPDYLTWALQTPELCQAIRASTGQVTIGKLALFRIEDLTVPFPDIEMQRGFAQQMKALTEKRLLLLTAVDMADSLFASLQHRAFRGEL